MGFRLEANGGYWYFKDSVQFELPQNKLDHRLIQNGI